MINKIAEKKHKSISTIDPITVEVIRNSFISIAKQMNQNLTRSAYTPIIYEMKDCSVGIFDRNINLVGQSSGLPVFLGTLGPAVKAVVESYKFSEIKVLLLELTPVYLMLLCLMDVHILVDLRKLIFSYNLFPFN